MALLDTVHIENCLSTLKRVPANYIDLVLTSPPYDNLRRYNGYSFDFENVAKELVRTLKKGGVIVWVVADQTINGSESGTSFRQALYFKELGLNIHDTMLYAKNNPIPLTHNRYEQAFEYMFCLSKGKPNVFNPIKEVCKTAGKLRKWESTKDVALQEPAFAKRKRNETTTGKDEKVKTNIFYYSLGGGPKTIHPAPFPFELALDQIKTWTNEGDIVYDPFSGSGRTLAAACQLNRRFFGSEISETYKDDILNLIDEQLL